MAVGDILKLTAIWSRAPHVRVMVNEWAFRQDSALVLDTPEEDLLTAFRDKIEDSYVALVTDFLTLSTYKVAYLPANDTVAQETVNVAGGSVGEPMPAIMSLFIRERTANFTRSGRGGFYLPPTIESANVNGQPTTTYINPALDMANLIRTDMAAGGLTYANWTWGVYSRKLSTFFPITSVNIPSKWSHQVDRAKAY